MEIYDNIGPVTIGPWTSYIVRTDPKHLSFILSRYKFCSKMLRGKRKVIEIGCGDSFGINIVQQTVEIVHGIDFEPLVIDDANKRLEKEKSKNLFLFVHDITKEPLREAYDAAFSLDVIEHIPNDLEHTFMKNICTSLDESGIFIVGTPNITASEYASDTSREGHINLKSAESLEKLMSVYFQNVFSFSMNDEIIHTGFSPMANYLICIGVGNKNPNNS